MRKAHVAVGVMWMVLTFPACMGSDVDGERPDSGGCGGPDYPDPDPVPCDGGLIISEVMPKPGAGADYEWFEVLNGSSETVALDGVNITRSDNDEHRIEDSGVELAPGEHAVIARSGATDIAFDYETGGDIQLPDSGENTLLCLTCDGEESMDCVEYVQDGFPGVSTGIALQLDVDGSEEDNDFGQWWCQADTEMSNGDFGTPGAANSECPEPVVCPNDADLLITELMTGPTDLEFIEVYNAGSEDFPWSCAWFFDGKDSRDLDGCVGSIAAGAHGVIAKDLEALTNLVAVDSGCDSTMSLSSQDSVTVGWYDALGQSQQADSFACDDTSGCSTNKYFGLGLDPTVDDPGQADDPAYWCDQATSIGTYDGGENFATPGSLNDSCDLPVDGDGDGWPEEEDCDDDDPDRHPGAEEQNGDDVDSDCDGYNDIVSGMEDVLPGELVITEFMPNPQAVGDSDGEYVEFINLSGEAVNVLGLEISKAGSSVKTVTASIVIEDGAYFVFARSGDETNGSIGADWDDCPSLTNSNDTITLSYGGSTLDEVAYTTGFGFGDGVAAELSDVSLDNSVDLNWCAAQNASPSGDLGSPGEVNSCL